MSNEHLGYADDPFKAMARECDRRVIARGGRSIFEARPVGKLSPARDKALTVWAYGHGPVYSMAGLAHSAESRTRSPKPQRIMGGVYGILGSGSLRDFDEM